MLLELMLMNAKYRLLIVVKTQWYATVKLVILYGGSDDSTSLVPTSTMF
jgi:hypothetical protein